MLFFLVFVAILAGMILQFVLFYFPETKRETIEQIQKVY